MRLIDADDFDRWLANAEFTAALNNADDNDRPFEHEAMYYSTKSFRDVMSYRPTIDAIPVEWMRQKAEENSHYAEPYFAFAYVLHEWQQTKSIEELQAESEMRDWKQEQEENNEHV